MWFDEVIYTVFILKACRGDIMAHEPLFDSGSYFPTLVIFHTFGPRINAVNSGPYANYSEHLQ